MSDKSSPSQEYEVTDGKLSLPVASPQYLLSEVLARLTALEAENAALREEIASIREDARVKDLRMDALSRRLGVVADQIETPAPTPSPSPPPSIGHKTASRVEELKARLKKRRGRAPFSELKEEMGLSSSQFSQLARKLDKRIFDIQRHPSKPKEKILILRQQIGVS